jgi:mitochondrial fission protein ELM1
LNNLPADKPLVVWFFTDDKPGHLNQLKGLESRLTVHADIESRWFSISNKKISWFDALLKRFSYEGESAPDLVVGAGRRTHKYLVATKRSYECFSLVLMRPSLPLSLFDAAVIPEHDSPPIKDNILVTVGVLNNVVPRDHNVKSAAEQKRGLILIGGESKHYVWDDAAILQQLESVVASSDNIDEWVLGNSRRTPESFLKAHK